MKKLAFIFALVFSVFIVNAQRGTLNTVTVDTLQGSETVNFTAFQLNGSYNAVSVSALCTQLGGTSDGTLAMYGSNDGTNYTLIDGANPGVLVASPYASIADTTENVITITNGLVANWVVINTPYRYYRVTGVGTASDTTKVNITYVYK